LTLLNFSSLKVENQIPNIKFRCLWQFLTLLS
jgi:hypothetical protein